MVEEQAQVIEVRGSQLMLEAQTQSACGNCSASKGCGTSVLSKVLGRKFSRFQAKNTVNARAGDTVVVGLSEEALLKASLVMYLVPILGMILVALLADSLLAASVDSRDLWIAASALLGLAGGAVLARFYFAASAMRFSPVVLRKITDHGKLPVFGAD
ncbi:MAG TPA: Fis family transcriptional regulator [Gammaproteobacteria bacterium]|nr:Fis family transcriptional regulator [Gammaproteobacteria bacterium]